MPAVQSLAFWPGLQAGPFCFPPLDFGADSCYNLAQDGLILFISPGPRRARAGPGARNAKRRSPPPRRSRRGSLNVAGAKPAEAREKRRRKACLLKWTATLRLFDSRRKLPPPVSRGLKPQKAGKRHSLRVPLFPGRGRVRAPRREVMLVRSTLELLAGCLSALASLVSAVASLMTVLLALKARRQPPGRS